MKPKAIVPINIKPAHTLQNISKVNEELFNVLKKDVVTEVEIIKLLRKLIYLHLYCGV